MTPLINELVDVLQLCGLNHWGIVSQADYDRGAKAGFKAQDLAPGSRSILVVGSGGVLLWELFVQSLCEHPEYLTEHDHPLDEFVQRALKQASKVLGLTPHRWISSAETESVFIDFRALGIQAGLGVASRLGLIIHPHYGPWMALRAACFLPFELPSSCAVGDICGDCHAPCAEACPGGAFTAGSWDVGPCAQFHLDSAECSQSCAARMACPIGVDSVYSELQRRYHYNRSLGRKELAQALNIEHDLRLGVGPKWRP